MIPQGMDATSIPISNKGAKRLLQNSNVMMENGLLIVLQCDKWGITKPVLSTFSNRGVLDQSAQQSMVSDIGSGAWFRSIKPYLIHVPFRPCAMQQLSFHVSAMASAQVAQMAMHDPCIGCGAGGIWRWREQLLGLCALLFSPCLLGRCYADFRTPKK